MRDTSGGVGVTVGLVSLVILSVIAATVGLAAGATGADSPTRYGPVGPTQQDAVGSALQSDIDPDAVVLRVDLTEDGDARWTVDFRVRLDDDNTTAAFESVKADVRQNASAFTSEFGSGMRRTMRNAENRTGREMQLRNLTVTAQNETLPQLYGVITYQFTWTNFAVAEGGEIRAGDALSGLYLDGESNLLLAWPDGYETTSVTPAASSTRENAVVWDGRLDFGPEEPRLVVSKSGGGPGLALPAAAVVVAVAAVGGGWVVYSRRNRTAGPSAASEHADGDAAAGTVERSADDGAGPPTGSAAGPAADGDDPAEELLSNEEKVLGLLEESGGRIKQQQIAGEFDWTDAKTSQVVGKLRDADEVETFRIGRENVVALPGEADF